MPSWALLKTILGNCWALLALSWEDYAFNTCSRTLLVGGDRAIACCQNSCQQSIRIKNEPKIVDQHLLPGFLMIVGVILGDFEAILDQIGAILALSLEGYAPNKKT